MRPDVRGRRDAPGAPRHVGGATRLFETEVRPLALARVVELDPAQRRAVENYRAEFARLRDLLHQYGEQLDAILARAGGGLGY